MRLVNRPLALILAVALVAVSIVLIVEVIGFAAHRSPLLAAATGIDGISSAKIKIRRRRARVTAASAARGRPAATALTEPVTQAVADNWTVWTCATLRA
jgi:hypothetical protein